MISIQLKQKTRQVHTELEKLLIPPIKNVQSSEDYARILKLFYGFFSPVEQIITLHIQQEHLPDIAERRKSQLIITDLESFDSSADLKCCTNLPEITNTASAFGAMYVLEGSTLGGSVISAMLRNRAGIPENQLNFFNAYSDQTNEMWTDFLSHLNRFADEHDNHDEIIDGATDTFLKFKNWAQETDGRSN